MALYEDDQMADAKRLFDKITQIFEEDGITPTPINYLVWYAYLKGDNPELRKEMDEVLKDPFGYHDRIGRHLYHTYLEPCDDSSTGFDLAFRRLLNAMAKKFEQWTKRLDSESKQLEKCTSSLEDPNLSQEQIRQITQVVLETAQSMQADSQSFKTEMLDTADEVKQLREELIKAKAQVLTDELTEVGNRKAFNEAIQELTVRAVEEPNASVCLIMTDIDHFKRFNDEFGHLVGDSVLRYFASIMKKLANENETVCRYGGEEFAILITDVDLEIAKQRAELVRSKLESARLKRKGSEKQIGKITASFGVACYDKETPETVDEFIARADKALYQAKESGRNRVVTELELPKAEK